MSKKIILPILIVLTALLCALLYNSVDSKIQYDKRVKEVEEMVKGRLDTLRKMELAYRDIHGEFAGSFEQLLKYFNEGKYYKVKEIGDNDGETVNVKRDTTFLNPKKEILGSADININHLQFVPPMDTAKFIIFADKITQSNVIVPVFEIKDPYPISKDKKALAVGSRNSPVTSGNWK